MRVHHLDCACMCPFGGARLGGVDRMVGHCLVVERPSGLVLVDTGFGRDDGKRLPLGFRTVVRPRGYVENAAYTQLVRLGYKPEDVRDIIVTHLDLDHAGGLSDFPHANVHVHAFEIDAARNRPTLRDRARYVPAQWAHGPKFVPHEATGEAWFGFAAVRDLFDGIVAIPLPGHTRGHWAIAVRAPATDATGGPARERWLLHCGDQYAHKGMLAWPPTAPWGIKAFERNIAWDHAQVRANQERIRELAKNPDVTLFSAHDADEFAALATPTAQAAGA